METRWSRAASSSFSTSILVTNLHHNGGALHFGTDGKLYIASGNNVCNDCSQDLTDLFGKILRINTDSFDSPPTTLLQHAA